MVQRIGGSRRKARYKLKKKKKHKGKLSLKKYLEEYKTGERIVLKPDPFVQKGIFHLRFAGKAGVVKKKTGTCYEVVIKDFKKEKKLIVHPVHMKKG
ncbi:50S ribosomal protein L21e [Candidatus Woesearchaeota archaeon]|nr:50S ribosomal protein L21e [Candidatus Woesearchaeota archaeon]